MRGQKNPLRIAKLQENTSKKSLIIIKALWDLKKKTISIQYSSPNSLWEISIYYKILLQVQAEEMLLYVAYTD